LLGGGGYGLWGNLDLRNWLEAHAYPYVLAVACDEPVGIVAPDGQRRRVEVREVEALVLHEHDWQRLAMSEGTKGPRLFDWAAVPILHQWEGDDGQHWLLIRRIMLTRKRSAIPSSLPKPAPRSKRWCRPVANAGILRRISNKRKTWAWITMKCAAFLGGTGM